MFFGRCIIFTFSSSHLSGDILNSTYNGKPMVTASQVGSKAVIFFAMKKETHRRKRGGGEEDKKVSNSRPQTIFMTFVTI